MSIAFFYTKVHSRVLRGGLSQLFDGVDAKQQRRLIVAVNNMEAAIDDPIACAKLAA